MLLVLCQTRHPVHSPHWGSETGSWRQNASVALGDTQSQEKYIAEKEKNKKKIFAYSTHSIFCSWHSKYGSIDSDTNYGSGMRLTIWAHLLCYSPHVTKLYLKNIIVIITGAEGAGQWSRVHIWWWSGGRGAGSRARYEVPTLLFTVGTLYLARENAVKIVSFLSWPSFFILEVFLSHLCLQLDSKHEGSSKHL